MKVGYAVLYEDGELVISKNHTLLQKNIIKDYGLFKDNDIPWRFDELKIKTVRILDQVKVNYIKTWFEGCSKLTTLIDFQNLDVSDCKDFAWMFHNCKSLQNINGLRNWNVSNGMNFRSMFRNCESLQDINVIEKWNIVNGTNFTYMFVYCENLKEIFLPNTLKILTEDMFTGCNPNLKIHWKNHIYTYEDLMEYKSF